MVVSQDLVDVFCFTKFLKVYNDLPAHLTLQDIFVCLLRTNKEFVDSYKSSGGSIELVDGDSDLGDLDWDDAFEAYDSKARFDTARDVFKDLDVYIREALAFTSDIVLPNLRIDEVTLNTFLIGVFSNINSYPILEKMLHLDEFELSHLAFHYVEQMKPACEDSTVQFCSYISPDNIDYSFIGRDVEIQNTVRALSKKNKSSVIYVGEAGVGKTSLIHGLVKYINTASSDNKFKDYKVFSLDVSGILVGTEFRGAIEGKIDALATSLKSQEKAILFVDNIHCLYNTTTNGSSTNLIGTLLTKLEEAGVLLVCTTTHSKFRTTIESDDIICSKFNKIVISEPSKEDVRNMLIANREKYETFHNVKYSDAIIDIIIDLAEKHMRDRKFPDKAFDILDEVGVNLQSIKRKRVITRGMVEKIVSEKYGIPMDTVTSEETSMLLNLESALKSKIFGQDDAIQECVKAIKLSRLGLLDDNKPMASFLFVGQTGVGKTELARQLASSLHMDFVKFDMSEYSDSTTVNKLIGSSAGYVGYNEGGLLVNTIRKTPNCVLLLDEIEKAHPSVYNILLQVMDDAKLTDNKGNTADFRNVIVIMTSNAGASGVKVGGLGFNNDVKYDYTKMSKAVESTFTPEFRNRLTKVIYLNSMSDKLATGVVTRELSNLKALLKERGIDLSYNKSVVNYCTLHGITKEYGARPLIQLINDDVKTKIADELLTGKCNSMKLTCRQDKILVTVE